MFKTLKEDIKTVFAKDPAARSVAEVLLCYPGLHALWMHRAAHFCWEHRMKLAARYISHVNRGLTGIEIHPGARIGRRFFIDHGSGVVIGETAEIGDDVLIYAGVVLGGTSLEKVKRHPTIRNRVEIGTGAVVLGAIEIGDDARIGSGSVVVKPVPPGVTVVGVPGRIVTGSPRPIQDLEHARLPDPVTDFLRVILEEQDRLRERINVLENRNRGATSPSELVERLES